MIAFSSTHAAITAQRDLTSVCPVQAMPVLREVSASCGMALRFGPEHLKAVRAALCASPLLPEEYAVYAVTGSGKTLTAEKL